MINKIMHHIEIIIGLAIAGFREYRKWQELKRKHPAKKKHQK